MSYLRLAVLLCVALASVGSADAQLPDMQGLADHLAPALTKSKRESVIVLDFSGPDEKLTELGRLLADNFSTALAKSSDKFSVTDRGEITGSLAKRGLPPSSFGHVDIALWLTGELKIESAVLGKITLAGDSLSIEVNAYRVDSGKWINGFKAASSISDQMRSLMAKLVEYPAPQIDPTVPVSGKNGYTYPSCANCPPARYSDAAVKSRTQGTVVLSVVVGVDGKAHDVIVVKPLPDGHTQKAIDVVESWQFKPAKGPHGNPAAVRQTIEVTFHRLKPQGTARFSGQRNTAPPLVALHISNF